MAKHVLIVDDEKRIREVVEYALQKDGFRVSSAADGLSAPPPGCVATCRSRKPCGESPVLTLDFGVQRLYALGADAVREKRVGAFLDVGFDLRPGVVFVANPFA